ncbi:MAG: hypothetical protein ACYC0F_01340 [Rhodanobacter sp.]
MKPVRKVIIFSALIMFVTGCNFSNSWQGKHQDNLSASAAKASQVASDRFAIFIASEKKYGSLGIFLSDIKNYKKTVSEKPDGYLITFLPKNYQGRSVFGGGGSYLIDKNQYRVIQEEHFK